MIEHNSPASNPILEIMLLRVRIGVARCAAYHSADGIELKNNPYGSLWLIGD
ncbi:hypothetical protein QVD99_004947 [Batrachochytrium dendrobatidis]|nr:hypothetical protein O5D80_004611 [Batrachochytrium dendrobatidis]KAK5667895.1 hypothetical protein QVD99_004947 [Batrachochytrium dendrobatidis]